MAVLYVLTGAVVDSLSGPGIMYLGSIGPGLVLALVDWLVAKTPIPAVIGTTLFAYGALVLFYKDGQIARLERASDPARPRRRGDRIAGPICCKCSGLFPAQRGSRERLGEFPPMRDNRT
jgi:hypothetical protein